MLLTALCLLCPALHSDSLWKPPNFCHCPADGVGKFLGFMFLSELSCVTIPLLGRS